jgi:hypothetical protein
MSEVHIEFSSNVRFAPFNGGYPEQAAHLITANLDPKQNLWYDIFDHNDPLKTHANWSLIPEGEYEEAWFPVGICEPAVPITTVGAINSASAQSNAGMQSFGFEQLMVDAKTVAPIIPIINQNENIPLPPPRSAAVTTNAKSPEKKIHEVCDAFASFTSGGNAAVRTKHKQC